MPPTSKTIFEEGAQIKSFKIVSKGKYDRDQLVKYLMDEPAKYEGCSGCRCLRDVESDLQAQIAANNKGGGFAASVPPQGLTHSAGVNLIYLLINEYGLKTVQDYMLHVCHIH